MGIANLAAPRTQNPAGFSISINPASGQEVGRYPRHDPEEQERIVDAAARAQSAWADLGVSKRGQFLARLAGVLRARKAALAACITIEMGKPISAARAEVEKCASLCDWYAEHAPALLADEHPDVGQRGKARICQLPLGVILGVMPWNFPLWQVLRAAVPILASGNAFLLKHADNVQGSACALAEAFAEAGMADGIFGVLNVRRNDLPHLIADRRVAAVTVTAGVEAGAAVASEAARHLKKSVLELGGSDPFIVLADADLDRAVAAAVEARFQNCGQVCIAAKRLIVERPIAQEFTRRFVAAAELLPQGDPTKEATRLGPMSRARARDELHAQVMESIRMGAKLLLGGDVPKGSGCYYPATVLTDVTPEMPVFREETFGPVAPIIIAEDAEEAIRIANDSDYGLAGAVWSGNAARATEVAERLETGGVFVNGIAASDPRVPIGGIKQSGFGRELSYFGLREFCNIKLIWTMTALPSAKT